METERAMQMLQDLVGAGTLLMVLVLRWTDAGNHFQAVTYDQERHAAYMDQYDEYTGIRNDILEKYGYECLDTQPYDGIKTIRAATKELKALRRAVKKMKEESQLKEGDGAKGRGARETESSQGRQEPKTEETREGEVSRQTGGGLSIKQEDQMRGGLSVDSTDTGDFGVKCEECGESEGDASHTRGNVAGGVGN
ncbi:hypothetical protein V7S43_010500 [Phytophthora oleae]|uniref:Uncharacterized protein n=1 Tax=Phytophthora oleae TaxID=2107226 RepID=A0ABD3FDF8_9STRA